MVAISGVTAGGANGYDVSDDGGVTVGQGFVSNQRGFYWIEGEGFLPVSSTDLNHDGFVDFFDVDYFLENF